MVVHTIFAIISDTIIKDVCVGDYGITNDIAHERYGKNAFAIEVTQYPVQEGDKYIDGEFRRYTSDTEYTVIEYIPTDTQKIESLEGKSSEATSTIEQNTNDITDLQVALAEIYEAAVENM